MTTPYEAPESLLDRLRDSEMTSAHIYEYLKHQFEWNMVNGVKLSYDPFSFFEGDWALGQYRQALEWWPKGKNVPDCPSLVELCFDFNAGPGFMARLSERAKIAAQLAPPPGKRPPQVEGETKEERDRRLNRERVTRHRQLHGKGPTPSTDPAVAEAYAIYMQTCHDRKAARADWDERVLEAFKRYEELRAKAVST